MSEAVEFRLGYAELLAISQVGCLRQIESILKGRKLRPWAPGVFDGHIYGAAGEYVVSRYLGLPWSLEIGRFGEPDVGECVHVRTRTQRRDGGDADLVVRASDPRVADHPWVHVLCEMPDRPVMRLVGWASDETVRQERYWKDPDGHGFAWWVPSRDLRPMHELRSTLRVQA